MPNKVLPDMIDKRRLVATSEDEQKPSVLLPQIGWQ